MVVRTVPWIRRLGSALGCALLVACSEGSPDALAVEPPSEVEMGRLVFEEACSSCHLQSEGFDLAFFDFHVSDVLRRARDHVDATEARAVAAYLESLPVARVSPEHRLFQPAGGALAESDRSFWKSVFGGDRIPDDFTPADLRAVDPRTVAIPFRLSPWSDEEGETDWMPDRPLAAELREADGGRVGSALERYLELPTPPRLVEAVAAFRHIAAAEGHMCAGPEVAVDRPRACFEARRWMAALAALHLVREGVDPPEEVLRLWWEVGQAAVSVRFEVVTRSELRPFERTALLWFYLSYQYAPDLFPSEAGYLGQFSEIDFPHFSTFTQLRRMVHEDRLEQNDPSRPFTDALRAVIRAPDALVDDVAVWAFRYLRDRLDGGLVLTGEDLDAARASWARVLHWYDFATAESAPRVAEARTLWEEVDERLRAMGAS